MTRLSYTVDNILVNGVVSDVSKCVNSNCNLTISTLKIRSIKNTVSEESFLGLLQESI